MKAADLIRRLQALSPDTEIFGSVHVTAGHEPEIVKLGPRTAVIMSCVDRYEALCIECCTTLTPAEVDAGTCYWCDRTEGVEIA